MTRTLLLVIAIAAATAAPASALNVTYDVVLETSMGTCGSNMTATYCDADLDGPSNQNGNIRCSWENGVIVCSEASTRSFP